MASISYGSYKIPGVSQTYLADYPNSQDVQRFSVSGGGTTQYFAATSDLSKVSSNGDSYYAHPVLKHDRKTYYFVKPLNNLYLRFKYIVEYSASHHYERVYVSSSSYKDNLIIDLYDKASIKIGIVDYKFKFPTETDMIVYTNSIGRVTIDKDGGWGFSTQTSGASAECFFSQKLIHDKTTWADDSTNSDTGQQSDNQHSAYLNFDTNTKHGETILIKLYIQSTTRTVDCGISAKVTEGIGGSTSVNRYEGYYSADGAAKCWGADSTCAVIMTYINSSGKFDYLQDSDEGTYWSGCSCGVSAKAIPAKGTHIGTIHLQATRWKVDKYELIDVPVPGSTTGEITQEPKITNGGTKNVGDKDFYREYRFVF